MYRARRKGSTMDDLEAKRVEQKSNQSTLLAAAMTKNLSPLPPIFSLNGDSIPLLRRVS